MTDVQPSEPVQDAPVEPADAPAADGIGDDAAAPGD